MMVGAKIWPLACRCNCNEKRLSLHTYHAFIAQLSRIRCGTSPRWVSKSHVWVNIHNKQTTKQHTNVFHLEFRTSFQSLSVRPISQCFCDLDRPRNVLRPNQCCWKLRCVCILEPWHSLPESLACLSGIALCSSLPYIPLPSQNDLVKNPEPSSNLNSVGAGAGNGTQNDIVEILKPWSNPQQTFQNTSN